MSVEGVCGATAFDAAQRTGIRMLTVDGLGAAMQQQAMQSKTIADGSFVGEQIRVALALNNMSHQALSGGTIRSSPRFVSGQTKTQTGSAGAPFRKELIMESKSQTNTLLFIIVAILALGGAFYYYNNYIEPQTDGPMEKAGEKLDDAIGK